MFNQIYEMWKIHAPVNDPDIGEFFYMINNIQKNKNFTFIRLNDGEYSCLFSKQSIGGLLREEIIEKYVENLNELIDLKFSGDNKNLLLGFETQTLTFDRYEKHLTPIIEKIDKIYSSSIFSYASITHDFPKLFNVLSEKNILLVGPEYLNQVHKTEQNKYGFESVKHIVTSTQGIWNHQQDIEDKIENYIIKNPGLIILYASSIITKMASLKFYKKYKNLITQIDIGAAFDPYFKISSRPWHELLTQELYK
jgi:hypothetical protein